MNQRTLLDRLLSPAGFGLVLLLFLIPFATVSCGVDTEKVDASFTGLDLIVGGQPDITGPNIDSEAEAQLAAVFQEDYDPQPLVIVAAVLILIGMALALIPMKRIRTLGSAVAAAISVILLAIALFLQAPGKADAAMDKFRDTAGIEEPINPSTTPAYGFWVAAVLLLGLAGWNGYEAFRDDKGAAALPAGGPLPGGEPEPAAWPQPGAPGAWSSEGPSAGA